MKIEEIFNQLKTYNELSNFFGEPKRKLSIWVGDIKAGRFETFEDFKNYLSSHWVESFIEEILKQELSMKTDGVMGNELFVLFI